LARRILSSTAPDRPHFPEYGQREFSSLLEIRDNYPKIVLYQEGTFRGNHEGIPAVPVREWLEQN